MSILLQLATPSAEEISEKADSAKVAIEHLAEEFVSNPSAALQDLVQSGIHFGLKVVAAFAIYIIGAWFIKRIKRTLIRIFERRNTEKALATFVISLVGILLTVLLIVITIGTLGINTSSLAALLAAGGVAIGMALSGTVQNFAGGIMILAFKPFKAGDLIEAQGFLGIVSDVTIVSTSLTTLDNRCIVIPNGALFNGNINNYSRYDLRRLEWTVSLAYGVDSDAAIAKLMTLIKSDPRVVDAGTKGAADPFVALQKLDASSVNFIVRAWVHSADYWDVYFDFNKTVYTEMPKEGFGFPFPQLDIHIQENKATAPDTARNA